MLLFKKMLFVSFPLFILSNMAFSQFRSDLLLSRFNKDQLTSNNCYNGPKCCRHFFPKANTLNIDCSYADNEEDEKLIVSCAVIIMFVGYYSYNKGDVGSGHLFSFLGSEMLFFPLSCKLSTDKNTDKTDRRKFIWHLIGIPTSWTIGMYYTTKPEPDDVLGGALVTTGLLIADIIGAQLLFKNK